MDADHFATYWGYVPPKNGKKKKKYGGRGGGYGKKKQSPWADSERLDDEKEKEDEGQSIDTTLASSCITNPQFLSSFLTVPIEELVKCANESNIDYDLLGTL
eukprot:7188892-Ditylum_brightwellii.AAC.1